MAHHALVSNTDAAWDWKYLCSTRKNGIICNSTALGMICPHKTETCMFSQVLARGQQTYLPLCNTKTPVEAQT